LYQKKGDSIDMNMNIHLSYGPKMKQNILGG